MSNTRRYVAEPSPRRSSFLTPHPSVPWRLRVQEGNDEPRTIGDSMTQEEARACERVLSELPGAVPVDEAARARLERSHASVVACEVIGKDGERQELPVEQPAAQVSTAPFVPYSEQNIRDVAKVAQMLLDRKLAPHAGMTDAMARAVLTLAAQLERAKDSANEAAYYKEHSPSSD